MALSRAAFLTRFPEFSSAPVGLVDSCLAEAERLVHRPTWGSRADDGVGQYAAHLIACNPLGERAKLIKKDGSTHYLAAYTRLRKLCHLGPQVV